MLAVDDHSVEAAAVVDRQSREGGTAPPGELPGPPPPLRILGPAECPIYRLNNYYRFHFQVQSPDRGRLQNVLRRVLGTVRPPAAVEFQIDMDPYSML